MWSRGNLGNLAITPFPTLKHLDIITPIEMPIYFSLIRNLTGLEVMQCSMIQHYNRHEFLMLLNRLLSVTAPNRPELKINFMTMTLKCFIDKNNQVVTFLDSLQPLLLRTHRIASNNDHSLHPED